MINIELLKSRRKELGFSQNDLAERVARISQQAFSQQAVAKVEKGRTGRPKMLPHICQALGLSVSSVDSSLHHDDLSLALEGVASLPLDKQVLVARDILERVQRQLES